MANPFDAYHAQQTMAPRPKAATNFFSQFDSEPDDAPPVLEVPQLGPRNFFDRFDNEPDAEPRNTSPRPAFEELDPVFRQYAERQSLDNARGSARVMTDAERRGFGFGKIQRPTAQGDKEDASFWGSLEHGLGNRNLEAYADTLEHLADMSGDPSYAESYREWSGSLRKTVKEDGSDYRPVFQSFKDINGLGDAWSFAKERVGEQIGMMVPTITGSIAGGYLGQKVGGLFGRYGRVAGGFTGAGTGALSGSVHLHVSEMRRALQGEKIEGDDLVKYTNYGTMVLAGLDLAFPVVAGLKWSGPARQAIARKIALQLAKGGKFRAPSEFIKRFGKEIVKDAILLEVPTEIAQEAVTAFVPPAVAGREVTDEEIQHFIFDTVPEVAITTALTAGTISTPGSAMQARRDVHAGRVKRRVDAQNPVARALNAQRELYEADDDASLIAISKELRAAVQELETTVRPDEIREATKFYSWDKLDAEKVLNEARETARKFEEVERSGFGAGAIGRRAKGVRL